MESRVGRGTKVNIMMRVRSENHQGRQKSYDSIHPPVLSRSIQGSSVGHAERARGVHHPSDAG